MCRALPSPYMRFEILVLDLVYRFCDIRSYSTLVPMLFVLDAAFVPIRLCLLLSTLVCPCSSEYDVRAIL